MFVCVLFLVLSARTHAQFTSVFYNDSVDSHHFNNSNVSAAGDVNGDGIPDFMVGDPGDLSGGFLGPIPAIGFVEVFSGADGSLLHNLLGDTLGDRFGFSISEAGDVNNDGFDDILVGIPFDGTNGVEAGAVKVFSGLDGSVLFFLPATAPGRTSGWSVAGLGDINGDGHDDFAVGEPQNGSSSAANSRVRIFSGIDGSLIRVHLSPVAIFSGASVANAHDVNGDGTNDLIVGQPKFNPTSFGGRGRAQVFSGADGSLIHTVFGTSADSRAGESVDGIGDINGDGFGDFIVNEPSAATGNPNITGLVRIFSGLDKSVLHTFVNPLQSSEFGTKVAGIGDADGDGVSDFCITQMGVNVIGAMLRVPVVKVFSGASQALIAELPANLTARFQSVDDIGDINGDGKSDTVVGSFSPSFNGTGGDIRVYLNGVEPVSSYSSNSGNPAGLTLLWQPNLGNVNLPTGTLLCTGATPGGSGLILASLAQADIPVFGFDLLVAIDPVNLALVATIGADFAGEFAVAEVSRRNPIIAGTRVNVQFIEIGPAIQASNGIQFIAIP